MVKNKSNVMEIIKKSTSWTAGEKHYQKYLISHQNTDCIFPQNIVETILEGAQQRTWRLQKTFPILCTFGILSQWWETPQSNTHSHYVKGWILAPW